MTTSSEKSNAAPERTPGRWTPEEARAQGRRGGIARWAPVQAGKSVEDVDEPPEAVSA